MLLDGRIQFVLQTKTIQHIFPEKIKKIDNEVKVCFLTALSELHEYESFRREVFPKEGERYFIQKPIENKEMLDRINEIMSSSNQI